MFSKTKSFEDCTICYSKMILIEFIKNVLSLYDGLNHTVITHSASNVPNRVNLFSDNGLSEQTKNKTKRNKEQKKNTLVVFKICQFYQCYTSRKIYILH